MCEPRKGGSMTVLIKGRKNYFLGAQAFLIEENRETASEWAAGHIKTNPAIKWILGRFVEADNPNNNRQTFALEDLRISQPTINHAPLNMVHQANHIVGSYVATEMIYPTDDSAAIVNPYIEALAAFWSYYFPDELKDVQKAHDEGSLYFSMECVAENVKFEDLSTGQVEQFPYMGPFHDSYGDWNTNQESIKWLDKPHFLGGALIVPPIKPGWSNAEIKSLSHYMKTHQEMASGVFTSVKEQTPHLSDRQIEDITIGLIKGELDEDWSVVSKNSKNSDLLTNTKSINNSDETVSEIVNPEGGDMSDKTYSEDEVVAAIAAALKPVQEELSSLQAKAKDDAVEARLEEMKEAHDAEIAEIRVELDGKVIEAQTAKEQYDQLIAWLDEQSAQLEQAAERASREESRLAAVAKVIAFPDAFVQSNTERWVSMSDEDFEALVESYNVAAKIAAGKNPVTKEVSLAGTAMSGERETSSENEVSILRTVMQQHRSGLDVRLIN